MKSKLDTKVLVISENDWETIGVTTAWNAICRLVAGRAKVLDTESATMYDFDGWIENWSDVKKLEQLHDKMIVSSQYYKFPIPQIITARKNPTMKFYKKPTISRASIFNRDRNSDGLYQCQYCGMTSMERELFNIDHVMPKGKGGKTEFLNVVLSCVECNTKKGCRTPDEAGMVLLRKPFEPIYDEIVHKFPDNAPSSWKEFVDDLYWNAGLT